MRNLAKYPVTRNEKLAYLDELIEAETRRLSAPDAPIGGLSLVMLQEIKKDVEFASDDSNQRIVRNHHSDSSMRSMAAQIGGTIEPR